LPHAPAETPSVDDLLAFLAVATTPFHAVAEIARRLDASGFVALDEAQPWTLQPGGHYYIVRNQGSIIAFRLPAGGAAPGLRMVGAHTDSPCLKLKPSPVLAERGLVRLAAEVYGGVLLNPWFDRDLSLAGRVHFADGAGALKSALIDFRRPLAVVPSLAIHLDREANTNRSINAQRDLPALLATVDPARPFEFSALLAKRIAEEHPGTDVATILDHELCLYDSQPPARGGLEGEFVASARLDNLVSCWCGLAALLASEGPTGALLVCNDHEEVGSASSSGAAGPFLRSVLERIASTPDDGATAAEACARLVAHSMLISADNAHAVHPNFADRHDAAHGPVLGGGPVIKVNANQRYASNSATQALFRHLCAEAEVPVQVFVTRTDLACGSTIGPITASEIGVRTLDVGVPQLAMHSIRELCHAEDPPRLVRALAAFQALPVLPALD
jgi:aspartyl aminopeptidase